MPIDRELEAAIEQAAEEFGQSRTAARRLVKWLTDMSDRELVSSEELQHLGTLRSAIRSEADREEQ